MKEILEFKKNKLFTDEYCSSITRNISSLYLKSFFLGYEKFIFLSF